VGDALTVVNGFVVAVMIGVSPALADTVTCSMCQGITTCSSPGGYVSPETTWNGITTGSDNQGGKWTRSEWQGQEIITVTPRQER
jgi:hypothetical protein